MLELPARLIRHLERPLFGIGAALLAFAVIGFLHGALSSSASIRAFEVADESIADSAVANEPATTKTGTDWQATDDVDQTLWADGRKRDYEEALRADLSLPEALLEIPSLKIKVPVFEGIDELTLNRGIGRVPGTAAPGSPGNIGLAGHRDGFFRSLKDIGIGDSLTIRTLGSQIEYEVVDTMIVSPEELEVLRQTEYDRVTLVTCYPFYFIGSAPQRFIVRADRVVPSPVADDRQAIAQSAQNEY